MKYCVFKCLLSAFSLAIVFGVGSMAQESAGHPYAMEFSGILRDPVSSATGFAGMASISTMAWASFDNPAVMSFYDGKFDARLLFQNWQPEYGKTTNLGTGIAFRTKKGLGLSVGFLNQLGQPFEVTDGSGLSLRTYRPSEMQFNLGFGFKIADFVSIGLSLKRLSEQFTTGSIIAFGGDFFAMAKLMDFNIALGVSNVGTPVKSSSGRYFNLPSSIRLGGDYSKTFVGKHNIEVLLDIDYFFLASGFSVAFGGRYAWKDMIFVRAGYHFGTDKALLPSFASVGLGMKVYGICIDVAYLLCNDVLKNTFSVGLGYMF